MRLSLCATAVSRLHVKEFVFLLFFFLSLESIENYRIALCHAWNCAIEAIVSVETVEKSLAKCTQNACTDLMLYVMCIWCIVELCSHRRTFLFTSKQKHKCKPHHGTQSSMPPNLMPLNWIRNYLRQNRKTQSNWVNGFLCMINHRDKTKIS